MVPSCLLQKNLVNPDPFFNLQEFCWLYGSVLRLRRSKPFIHLAYGSKIYRCLQLTVKKLSFEEARLLRMRDIGRQMSHEQKVGHCLWCAAKRSCPYIYLAAAAACDFRSGAQAKVPVRPTKRNLCSHVSPSAHRVVSFWAGSILQSIKARHYERHRILVLGKSHRRAYQRQS